MKSTIAVASDAVFRTCNCQCDYHADSDNVLVACSDSPHYQSLGSAVVSQTAEKS
jgi:hypothetical protein